MSELTALLSLKSMTTLAKTRTATSWVEAPLIRTAYPTQRRIKVAVIIAVTLFLLATTWTAVAIASLAPPANPGIRSTVTPTGTTIPAHPAEHDVIQRLLPPNASSSEERNP